MAYGIVACCRNSYEEQGKDDCRVYVGVGEDSSYDEQYE